MTATVQPGVVLDQLNAFLRPHGVWFPVDVSTSAQATIGGMAGNNSCGSRSIEYGNMVHNVAGIDAILADGSEIAFGPIDRMRRDGRSGEIVAGAWANRRAERDEIERSGAQGAAPGRRLQPRSLRAAKRASVHRRWLGQSRPSSRRLRRHARLVVATDAAARAAAAAQGARRGQLSVVSTRRWRRRSTSCASKPTAVELVDRTMIDLARANPAFRPVIERALIGEPAAILLVEFCRRGCRRAGGERLDRLAELMGDLGLPDAVVRIDNRAGAEGVVGSAQGRPQHHDVDERRRQAGVVHRGLRGAARASGRIHRPADAKSFASTAPSGTWYAHASVGTLHVRPILDMRRDGAAKMRAIAEEAAAMVREYKGAYSGEHGDGLCRGEWVAWQFGPRLNAAFGEIKALFDPDNRMNPGKIVAPPKMDEPTLFRFRPGTAGLAFSRQLDWSAWNVERDPLTGDESAPGTGGDPTQGLAKAVEMCNNNGHCRKFDAGERCARAIASRATSSTRRAGAPTRCGSRCRDSSATRISPATPCMRCARPVRVVQGLQARVPDRRRHGQDQDRGAGGVQRSATACALRDRLIALPAALCAWSARWAWLANLRDAYSGRRAAGRSAGSGLRRVAGCRNGAAASCAGRPIGRRPRPRNGREVVLFVDTFSNYFAQRGRGRRAPRARSRRIHGAHQRGAGRTAAVLRTHLSRRGNGRPGEGRGPAHARRHCSPTRGGVWRSSASSRRACSRCATNS